MKRGTGLAAAILLVVALVLVGGGCEKETGVPSGCVVEVIDGDTVDVVLAGGHRERIRLIGVDTPEVSGGTPQPYGQEAAAFTADHLGGMKVWLETDVQERDRYGRLLAYVWLSSPEAHRSVAAVRADMFNARLVCEGYAQVLTVPPNIRYADLFTQWQKEARQSGKGLWGLPVDTEPYYIGSARSKKFHRPDCRWAQQIKPANKVRFATRDEAMDAGYEPCRECHP